MTYNELKTRFKELLSRRGRGSIKAKDILTLILDLIDKIMGIDVSATATIRKSYNSLAEANADKILIDPETNKPLKIGQLISVVDDTNVDNNAIYRLASIGGDGTPTWERQAALGDMTDCIKRTEVNRVLDILEANMTTGYLVINNSLVSYDLDGKIHFADKFNSFDSAWVMLDSTTDLVSVKNAVPSLFSFFSSFDISNESYLGKNTTGKVVQNAKVCVINFPKSKNPSGLGNIEIIKRPVAITDSYLKEVFGGYIQHLTISKNLINVDNLLYGYYVSLGKLVKKHDAIMSNKLYLKSGETYTIQECGYYGELTSPSIYTASYNKDGDFLGRKGYKATISKSGTRADATFIYDNVYNADHIRIILQVSGDTPLDKSLIQLEKGSVATEIDVYKSKEQFFLETQKTKVRILAIGNSYSQHALAYVPFLLKNINPNLLIDIGLMYIGGSSLQQHLDNLNSGRESYMYYKFNSYASSWTDGKPKSIQGALDEQEWDIVLLHQQSTASVDYTTYTPVNDIIDGICNYINYGVKFGWVLTPSSSKGASDSEILEKQKKISINAQAVLDDTPCEFVIPVGTAIQKARTTELNALGDSGKLMADGIHLQEGLPCQIASYTVLLSILEILGDTTISILGDKTICSDEWIATKNIPGKNGTAVTTDKDGLLLAQKCAIYACKNPFAFSRV